ncbi:MAG: T9SS type A sorting domain-containing protein [Bacteroidota bacterium]
MRVPLLFIALAVGFLRPASAQEVMEDTTSAWRYYPLHVGDAWEYEVEAEAGFGVFIYTVTRLVRRDTVVDGTPYALLEQRAYDVGAAPGGPPSFSRYLVRFDTSRARIVTRSLEDGLERPGFCPLDLPFGAIRAECGGEIFADVVGGYEQPVHIGEMSLTGTLKGLGYYLVVGYSERFAADLGLVGSYFNEAGTEEWRLQTARIEGEVVGDLPGEYFPGVPDPVEPERYYPLDIGDERHYWLCRFEGCGQSVTTEKVIGEEVVSNTLYRVVNTKRYVRASDFSYELASDQNTRLRFDEATASVVTRTDAGESIVACNLGADLGPPFPGDEDPCAAFVGIYDDPDFGRVKDFDFLGGAFAYAADIGLVRFRGDASEEETVLFYSNIAGVERGTPFSVAEESGLERADLVLAAAPNPAVDRVVLSLRLPEVAILRLEAFDARGRRVLSREELVSADARVTLDVSSWAPGAYSLRVTSGERTVVRRILVTNE